MWLVRIALRRPYTIAVVALLILLMGVLSATRMVVDIFPDIDIPVVMSVWSYPGLSAEDMERRIVIISERAYSTTVNGISRIESDSLPGVGLLKIYFQPGTESARPSRRFLQCPQPCFTSRRPAHKRLPSSSSMRQMSLLFR